MPERYFIDIDPELSSVPAETWGGATAEGVRRILTENATLPEGVDPETMSWREIAMHVKLTPPSDEDRALLEEIGPDLLARIDEELGLNTD